MVRKIYVCEICQEEYDTEEEALECEAQGYIPALFPIGTVLELHERYPKDSDNPYVERTIVEIVKGYVENYTCYLGRKPVHEQGYILDEEIQIGKELYVGENIPLLDSHIKWVGKHTNEVDAFTYIKTKNNLP
jgi:hypothetical protein